MWQSTIKPWLKAAWSKSWTTVLGWIKIWFGITLAVGSYIGHMFNDPGVQTALSKLDIPAEIGMGIAILGAIVLLSEAHSE